MCVGGGACSGVLSEWRFAKLQSGPGQAGGGGGGGGGWPWLWMKCGGE